MTHDVNDRAKVAGVFYERRVLFPSHFPMIMFSVQSKIVLVTWRAAVPWQLDGATVASGPWSPAIPPVRTLF